MGYGQRPPRRTKAPICDWMGTSNASIDRIRPRRHHFELAFLGAALMVSVAAVIAAPARSPKSNMNSSPRETALSLPTPRRVPSQSAGPNRRRAVKKAYPFVGTVRATQVTGTADVTGMSEVTGSIAVTKNSFARSALTKFAISHSGQMTSSPVAFPAMYV